MQHFTGVRAGGQQRVIAQGMGVAETSTLLGVAVDLADRRVDVHHQRLGVRAGTRCPGSFECVTDHGFHLPAVPNVNDRRNVPIVDGAITR